LISFSEDEGKWHTTLLLWGSDHTFYQFGKYIQAQQVPGWSPYYLDYKFLKKIISSLAANRPASAAAALASGTRPGDLGQSPSATLAPFSDQSPGAVPDELHPPPIFFGSDGSPDSRAHKAAFFFKLERELEKVRLSFSLSPHFAFFRRDRLD